MKTKEPKCIFVSYPNEETETIEQQQFRNFLISKNGLTTFKLKGKEQHMSKTLFEIEEQMYNLLEFNIDSETGEIIETQEEFDALYDSIQLDLQTKLDNTICLSKLIDGEIDVIDKEIKRLTAEKSSRVRKKDWLKNRVDTFVRSQFTDENGNLDTEGLNAYKLNLPHSKISYRKSTSVDVYDIDSIPKEFIKTKIETNPDKTAIKNAINNGQEIKGAKIVTNYGIQLK